MRKYGISDDLPIDNILQPVKLHLDQTTHLHLTQGHNTMNADTHYIPSNNLLFIAGITTAYSTNGMLTDSKTFMVWHTQERRPKDRLSHTNLTAMLNSL